MLDVNRFSIAAIDLKLNFRFEFVITFGGPIVGVIQRWHLDNYMFLLEKYLNKSSIVVNWNTSVSIGNYIEYRMK